MIHAKLDIDEAEFLLELVNEYRNNRKLDNLPADVGADETSKKLHRLITEFEDDEAFMGGQF